MSIKIHYGPPGSYKTSGAIQDDFVKAVLEGRPIVTNVRGLDDPFKIALVINTNIKKKHRKKSITKLPNITHVDTSTHQGKETMRRWFHWADKGAFILIDEINTIYDISWRSTKIDEFDYPGGLDSATRDERPEKLSAALEMHRHYNWDMVVTTPSIKRVHSLIKDVSEAVYRHKNKALIGLAGYYTEVFHEADNAGRSNEDKIIVRTRRIKRWIFDLYKSTQTGDISDTQAGQNIFTSPGVIMYSLFMVGLVSWLYSNGLPSFMQSEKDRFEQNQAIIKQSTPETARIAGITPPPRVQPEKEVKILTSKDVEFPADPLSDTASRIFTPAQQKQVVQVDVVLQYLQNSQISIAASLESTKDKTKNKTVFQVVSPSGSLLVNDDELEAMGINYIERSDCLGMLQYNGKIEKIVTCKGKGQPLRQRFKLPNQPALLAQ